jgi:type IV pilus assembly protein PilA
MDATKTPVRVPNYLVGSILATLFCCLPTGIASIVFASRANSKAATGDIQGAQADASKAKLWLWLSVIPGFLVMGLGILAAIALPAYQDYSIRAKVAEAVLAGSSVKTAYTEFVSEHHAWPSVEDLNLSGDALYKPGAYALAINDEHAIEITLAGASNIQGKTVLLVPTVSDDAITDWTCSAGTMPQKYLPIFCRGQ